MSYYQHPSFEGGRGRAADNPYDDDGYGGGGRSSADSFYIKDSRTLQKEIRDINQHIISISKRLDDNATTTSSGGGGNVELSSYSSSSGGYALDDVRSMIDKAVTLTSCAQKDVNEFKEYVCNAPTPQDAMNRQQMLNKFTNNVSTLAKQLEDVVRRYATLKKETAAAAEQQQGYSNKKKKTNKRGNSGGPRSTTSSSSSRSHHHHSTTATTTSSIRSSSTSRRRGNDDSSRNSDSKIGGDGLWQQQHKNISSVISQNSNAVYEYGERKLRSTAAAAAELLKSSTSPIQREEHHQDRQQQQQMGGGIDLEEGLSRDKLDDIKRIGAEMGELQDIYTTLNSDMARQQDNIDSIHDAMLRTLDTTQRTNIELQQATDKRDTSLKRKVYAFTALAATAGLYMLISSI
ncbi:hypothetical protein FOL46_008566 [Perkinsus olseni]|uniref:t-SNARE coiled-coil homology domain-containing protein n=1 Tax=Perkinsus olseni TaxID=32597 RepID=A0A7J6L6B4_PEROL|nr:hypothetical protein FOL46_008566 [Perkinsus olseni]